MVWCKECYRYINGISAKRKHNRKCDNQLKIGKDD
jgi:hypothetical protein